MAKQQKQREDDAPAGAPEWMVTFCDCMTLLLTFFVLLLSFATFHKETLPQLGFSFAQAMSIVGTSPSDQRDSIWDRMSSDQSVPQTEGSETRTPATQQSSNFMREQRSLDFRNLKVFSVPSSVFFWGSGAAISEQGRQVLDAMGVFLQHQAGAVVLSETAPDGADALGLERAQAVMNYLVNESQLDRGRFSLSASTTMREKSTARRLEITLLDRSVYE